MAFNDIKILNAPPEHQEAIRIYNNQKRVKAQLSILNFVDKDTGQHVFYMPAIELSGYGETKEKAFEMTKATIDEFFNYILKLPPSKQEVELSKFGFKQQKFQTKNYSKAYVDISGQLKNFNAVDDKVELLTLVA